jgi:hypothetical protein
MGTASQAKGTGGVVSGEGGPEGMLVTASGTVVGSAGAVDAVDAVVVAISTLDGDASLGVGGAVDRSPHPVGTREPNTTSAPAIPRRDGFSTAWSRRTG